MNESNAVGVREIDILCSDRIKVVDWKPVDEIRIPMFSKVGYNPHVNQYNPKSERQNSKREIVNEPFSSGQLIKLLLRTFNEDHELAKFLAPLPHNV